MIAHRTLCLSSFVLVSSFLAACSGDASRPPMLRSDGGQEAAVTTPVSFDDDAATAEAGGADAGAETSEGDANADGDADAPFDPLTACLGDEDIFVAQSDPGNVILANALVIKGSAHFQAETQGNGDRAWTAIVRADDSVATFSTEATDDVLKVATYIDAQRAGAEAAGHPGLTVSIGGASCDVVTGKFEILQLGENAGDAGAPQLKNFVGVFEQHCGTSAAALRGCVHFSR